MSEHKKKKIQFTDTDIRHAQLKIRLERENISQRIKASKKIAKDDRKYLGGYTEFGYKVENKKLVPDEKEFIVLQSMVNLRKSGLGYRRISDEIKNKFGKRIYFPQVHKILNRPHNRQLLEVA